MSLFVQDGRDKIREFLGMKLDSSTKEISSSTACDLLLFMETFSDRTGSRCCRW
jgi:hypothetical protein